MGFERPVTKFPISRDPPEGGTSVSPRPPCRRAGFPISRDPPEGGTVVMVIKEPRKTAQVSNF